MEWEQSSKNTETDEEQWEEYILNALRNSVSTMGMVSDIQDFECLSTTVEVDTQDTDNQKSRTTHQHQSQLHGRILLCTTTPYTDEEIHRNQRNLIEHEHGEHVNRDEETIYTDAQESEPEEVFLLHWLHLPRSKCTGEHNDGSQEKHHYRNTIHTE